MITEVDLMKRAVDATGLSDFGIEDGFRTALRVVLTELETSAYTESERETLRQEWQSRLETRLKIIGLRRQKPEIAAQVIEGPLVVTGLPRTGTTALIDLLAQDKVARPPLTWELLNFYPPAEPGHWHDDPRIAAYDKSLSGAENSVVAAGLHVFGATLPEECNRINTLNFWGSRYPGEPEALHLPDACEWFMYCRPPRPYAMHKMVLQHLQAHGPAGRWTLKTPHHIFALDQLLEEYPQAMIVQTHRDPLKVFPSLCGLTATMRGLKQGDPAYAATARYILERWGAGLKRCVAARRDPAVNSRIIDISQRQIIADPLGTVRMIYAKFGLELTAETQERMSRWLENPAQHESKTKFTLEEFGLTPADVERVIGVYGQEFREYF